MYWRQDSLICGFSYFRMEKQDVLKLCVENGFFLDRGMLDFFVEMSKEEVLDIVSKLKGFGVRDGILTKEVFDKYKNRLQVAGCRLQEEIESEITVLKNIRDSSSRIESLDFVNYFRNRFEKIRDILIKNSGFENLNSIRRIGKENGVFCVVGMIYDKRITKNKNLLIEIEDLTGRTVVLVNRENKQLFERACGLLLDDVLAFKCSGSSKMLFASDFVYPNSCLDSERFGDRDEYVAFVSDLHVGSKNFLEDNFVKFISWLNGDIGDDRQKNLACKVKYLVLTGDNIEGVGVYPGQEKFLAIKGCRGQYKKLAEILSKLRSDIEIIMVPGSHDAVWLGEPQPAINKKWAGDLVEMKNLRLVSNPALISIGGLNIMIYSGGSLNKFINELSELRINFGHRFPSKVIDEILKRRHLAPVYGEMDVVLNKTGDDLVLDELMDVFVVGGQHRAQVGSHNNILTISTSCFQSKTDFEIKNGSEPDPCKVPILNLKTREIKILDFSSRDDSGEYSGSDQKERGILDE